ncbi:MAG: isocitrate/isopropylmalate dehydrogenase family protein [Candidatus Sericytochromatia bacterium]|nr:isocitrate/isopropylmalate dehydrogenase family protein [Candidatus Tanganyikabacteria bacterium]
MGYRVTLIPGDGTGPEITEAAVRCLEATGVRFQWERVDAGVDYMERTGDATPLPASVIESIKRNKIALKGPLTTPIGTGFRSVNVALRQELDLYACVRPCRLFSGLATRYSAVDLVIIRENTEDLYAGIEFERGSEPVREISQIVDRHLGRKIREGSALSLKPISVFGSERIVRFAFEYALEHGRRKVTAVHKANIMKFTDGLFLDVARRVAGEYEGRVAFEDLIVDNTCMQLVLKPEQYDVLVLPNLYGDIISDLGAGLIGGLGVAPGANVGELGTVYEPTHGSAPKYAGKNKVDPLAMILSGALLLRDLGESAAADLEQAISRVLADRRALTYDLCRLLGLPPEQAVGTSQMADAIVAELGQIKGHKGRPLAV